MSTITNKGILNLETKIAGLGAKIHGLQAELETLISWRATLVERLKQAVEEENHRQAQLEAAIRKQNNKRDKERR